MLKQVAAALGFLLAAQQAGAEESALQKCQRLTLRHEIDCACTNSFLQTVYDDANVDIILSDLALEADGRDHHWEFLTLYLRHGAQSISRAMINFHWVRPYLLQQCPAPGLHQEDE
jgi:hypothetical protein